MVCGCLGSRRNPSRRDPTLCRAARLRWHSRRACNCFLAGLDVPAYHLFRHTMVLPQLDFPSKNLPNHRPAWHYLRHGGGRLHAASDTRTHPRRAMCGKRRIISCMGGERLSAREADAPSLRTAATFSQQCAKSVDISDLRLHHLYPAARAGCRHDS